MSREKSKLENHIETMPEKYEGRPIGLRCWITPFYKSDPFFLKIKIRRRRTVNYEVGASVARVRTYIMISLVASRWANHVSPVKL